MNDPVTWQVVAGGTLSLATTGLTWAVGRLIRAIDRLSQTTGDHGNRLTRVETKIGL